MAASTASSPESTLPVHVHRRDWRPCPATRPAPIVPTRAYARWLWAWSFAILHQETLAAFLSTVGAEAVTFGSPFDVTMRDGPDVRECLCGGEIVFAGTEPLQAVVQAHNRTDAHVDWETSVGLPWLADAGART